MTIKVFPKNAVIVPADAVYPNGALRVRSWEGDLMLATPLGGGFVYRFDHKARLKYGFRIVTKEERQNVRWRLLTFSLGDGDERYRGWWNGLAWNGWATPAFDLPTMRRIFADCLLKPREEVEDGLLVLHFTHEAVGEPEKIVPKVIEGTTGEPLYQPDGWTFVEEEDEPKPRLTVGVPRPTLGVKSRKVKR